MEKQNSFTCKINKFLRQPLDDVLAQLPAFINSLSDLEKRLHVDEIDLIRLYLLAANHSKGFQTDPEEEDYFESLLHDANQMVLEKSR